MENRLLLSGNVLASVTDGNVRIRGDAGANVIALDQSGLSSSQVRITGTDSTINGQGSVVLSGVTGKVSVRLGTGRDRVTMSNMNLPGDVTAEQRRLTMNSVALAGNLTVLSRASTTLTNTDVGTGLSITSTSASGNGEVTLADVSVQATTFINGGTGSDTIRINDSVFVSDVAIYTGLGDDVVQIEGRGEATGPATQFARPVTILLGSGNDRLQVGVSGVSGQRAVFGKRVLFDGKAGFDTYLNANNTTFAFPDRVQVINFESTPLGQLPINLGAATNFAVMATASISSTSTTVINGDVGLSPGSSQGIPPAQVNGTVHVNDPAAVAARADLLAAYNDAISRTVNAQTLPGNLGGLTLTPGLYTNAAAVIIEGSGPGNNLTLDAQGDPNAVFIFKMGTTLITGPGAQVILAGGAKASNVFWQVGSSATLNTTTIFKGSILAAVSITVNTGSVVRGRLLGGSSADGSVIVNASTISLPN